KEFVRRSIDRSGAIAVAIRDRHGRGAPSALRTSTTAHNRSAPMRNRYLVYPAVCAVLALQPVAATAQADTSNVQEAVEIATDAYVYGYSLVTTDVTRIQMSNVPAVEELRAPLNQFANVKRYPPADYRGVSAPNADTLYSVAWLDLAEPQVFSHPDMG